MPQIGEEVISKRTKNGKSYFRGIIIDPDTGIELEQYRAEIQSGQHYDILLDSGIASSVVDNYVIDTGKNWAANQFANKSLNDANNVYFRIISNNATKLSLEKRQVKVDEQVVNLVPALDSYRIVEFDDVDNTLEYLGGEVLDPETNEHFTHKCDKIDLPVSFNKFKQPIKIGKGQDKILIKPLGCNQVTGTKYQNKVTYVNAYDNVDVVRFAFADGYGESYTLTAPGHPTRFEFDVPVGKELLQQWLGHNCIEVETTIYRTYLNDEWVDITVVEYEALSPEQQSDYEPLTIPEVRVCTLTWTETGFYFDLPNLDGITYPIEVK